MEAVDARHLCVDFGVNHSPEAISQSLNAYPTLRPLGKTRTLRVLLLRRNE
jgi:hypothetical protein